MYMIAGLCMLKLYQTRHPDINASAYAAYASFATVIMLTVLGVVRVPTPPPTAFSPVFQARPLGRFSVVCPLDLRGTGLNESQSSVPDRQPLWVTLWHFIDLMS